MSNAITNKQNGADTLEQVLMTGNLAALTPEQRVTYYNRVCESVGLNPLTRPFDYLTLNGKLILYARKDATDQLRSLRGVSITSLEKEFEDGLLIVTAHARNADGREDADAGVVSMGNLQGDARANAIMKAITKAKRRVTLSICGLGWLDETEIETIPEARTGGVDFETGEVIEQPPARKVTREDAAPAPAKANGNAPAEAPPAKWKPDALKWMVKEGYADNDFNANAMWDLLELDDAPGKAAAAQTVKLYRQWRTETDATPEVAAAHAKAGNRPDDVPEVMTPDEIPNGGMPD